MDLPLSDCGCRQRRRECRSQEAEREQRDGAPAWPPALCIEEERDHPERNDVERVAGLRDMRVAVDRRLQKQCDRDRDGEKRESELRTDARTLDRCDRAENGAGEKHQSRADREDQRIQAERGEGIPDVDADVQEARVVPGAARRARSRKRHGREHECNRTPPMPAQGDLDALFAREHAHESDEEARQKHGELKSSEACENDEAEKERDRAPRRPVEGANTGRDRREDKRIRDRLGEHERAVEQARQDERECGGGKCVGPTEAKCAREHEDGDGRQRDENRIDRLRGVVARRNASEEPRRRGHERCEERCEVRRSAANVGVAARRDRTAELAVEVLIREVRGRYVPRRGPRADRGTDHHQRGKGQGGDPRGRERSNGRTRCGDAAHPATIGGQRP